MANIFNSIKNAKPVRATVNWIKKHPYLTAAIIGGLIAAGAFTGGAVVLAPVGYGVLAAIGSYLTASLVDCLIVITGATVSMGLFSTFLPSIAKKDALLTPSVGLVGGVGTAVGVHYMPLMAAISTSPIGSAVLGGLFTIAIGALIGVGVAKLIQYVKSKRPPMTLSTVKGCDTGLNSHAKVMQKTNNANKKMPTKESGMQASQTTDIAKNATEPASSPKNDASQETKTTLSRITFH